MNEISEKAVDLAIAAYRAPTGMVAGINTQAEIESVRMRAALTAALPHLMGEADEYEFEVWQDGNYMAGGYADDLESVQREANHYAMMYGQDGEVKVKIIERRMVAPTNQIDVSEKQQERGNG